MTPFYNSSGVLVGYQYANGLYYPFFGGHYNYLPSGWKLGGSSATVTPQASPVTASAATIQADENNAIAPGTLIADTQGNDSGYGQSFTAPTATLPGQSAVSGVTVLAIIILSVSVWYWFKYFHK